VLIAEACNIGLEPLVHHGQPALTRSRLSWVEQNYLRADTLTAANSRLVDAQTDIALAELGRIVKTLYLLAYLDDEPYRRRILTQLNRTEARHALARQVFHGQRGQLRQRYREGQEDQLGALGLVLNAIVLWNTRYLDAALNQLRDQRHPVHDDDVARLSPLIHQHINLLGRYHFTDTDPDDHRLRPLRDPASADD